MLKRLITACCSLLLLLVSTMAAAQPPSVPDGFVPASTLPPTDQVAAGPLLLAAYSFVWLAVLFYVWTVWRRLNKVEREMKALERRSAAR
jgi:CcmD family protein